jgi:hypothetical protein
MRYTCNMRAKEAVEAVINLFQSGPIQAPWEPHYITDYGRAWDTLASYPSYSLVEKWGITLEIEEGNPQSSWAGAQVRDRPKNPSSPGGNTTIIMRVTNPCTWLHELCHAAAHRLDPPAKKRKTYEEKAEEEAVAELSAAALLYLWQPDLDGEFRHCQEGIKLYTGTWTTRTPLQLCEDAREEAEKRVAAILEEV